MRQKRELLRPPHPWHVLLSPALPILALLAGNPGIFLLGAAGWSLTLATAAAIVGCLLLTCVTGKLRTSALATSVLVLMGLSQASIAQLARMTHFPLLVPLSPLVALVMCVFILRFGGTAERWTTFANVLMLVGTGLVTWPLVVGQHRLWRSPTREWKALDVRMTPAATRPDIYVLILDGYGRADVLHDYYEFDNQLSSELQSLGFHVARKAASNYAQTAQSLASSLNGEYLETLLANQPASGIPARQRFADLIAHNRTFATLASAGYRIRSYTSEYGLVQPALVHDRPHPWIYLTDFEYVLYEGSMLPLLSATVGLRPGWIPAALHRRHVRWTLDDLERDLPEPHDPPTLIFAHLLIPHPPFVFEPDGSPRASSLPANLNDGNHWRATAEGSGESYQDGYVSAVRFLNTRLIEIVRRVTKRADSRDAIIYVQGDHGPGSRLDWNATKQTDYRERHGILLAARFPPDGQRQLYHQITPVNAVRILLNCVAGTSLSLLEDRSYFSPWNEPLRFIDVTEHVH